MKKLFLLCWMLAATWPNFLHGQLAPDAEAALSKTLGPNWKDGWDDRGVAPGVATLSYGRDASAKLSFDQPDGGYRLRAGTAVVFWLESGQTLQCCRYIFWLQNDGSNPGFLRKLFGEKKKDPDRNPAHDTLRVSGDSSFPHFDIASGDRDAWPEGKPDSITPQFDDPGKPVVYIARGPGKLVPGNVTFLFAAPDLIAQGTTDSLVGKESDLRVDGGQPAGGAIASFRHVHRSPIGPLSPAITLHFIVIQRKDSS
jgi:hypothetical protein